MQRPDLAPTPVPPSGEPGVGSGMLAPPPPLRHLVLVAGPSGSGKSRVSRGTGIPTVRLDDFYRSHTDPGLPTKLGVIDWDDVATWDVEAAARTLVELVHAGVSQLPDYSIPESRRTGWHHFDAGDSMVILAEGIFAPDVAPAVEAAGVHPTKLWIDNPGHVNFYRRLRRDLDQKRKPPAVLVTRGLALWRREGALREHAIAAGFRSVSLGEAGAVLDGARTTMAA